MTTDDFFSPPFDITKVLIVKCQRCRALLVISDAPAHRDWHSRVDSGAVT